MIKKIKKLFKPPTPLQTNRKTHKKLKKEWDLAMLGSGLDVVELEEVVISEKGVPYYSYKDISTLVMSRKTHLMQALRKLEYSVNPQWLKSIREEMVVAVGKNDTKTIKYLLNEWELRENKLPEMEVLLEVASVFFVRFNENPYTLESLTQKKKMEEVGEDFILQNFFLQEAWDLFKSQVQKAWLEKFNASEIGDLANQWAMEKMEEIKSKTNP